jgi:hypothetical protein
MEAIQRRTLLEKRTDTKFTRLLRISHNASRQDNGVKKTKDYAYYEIIGATAPAYAKPEMLCNNMRL